MCVSQAENLLYEKSTHLQESYHQICQHHQLRLHFLFLLYDSNQLRSHMQSMITYLDFPDWVCGTCVSVSPANTASSLLSLPTVWL